MSKNLAGALVLALVGSTLGASCSSTTTDKDPKKDGGAGTSGTGAGGTAGGSPDGGGRGGRGGGSGAGGQTGSGGSAGTDGSGGDSAGGTGGSSGSEGAAGSGGSGVDAGSGGTNGSGTGGSSGGSGAGATGGSGGSGAGATDGGGGAGGTAGGTGGTAGGTGGAGGTAGASGTGGAGAGGTGGTGGTGGQCSDPLEACTTDTDCCGFASGDNICIDSGDPELGPACLFTCTADVQCGSSCCAETTGSSSVCGPGEFCGCDGTLDECNVNGDCCGFQFGRNVCVDTGPDGIGQVCLDVCERNSDCSDPLPCCSPIGGSDISVCTPCGG
jgi:hypothetical protein